MASRVLPFPFPLHVGTDVCHIARIHAILSTPRAPRFIRRVLAREELVRPRQAIAKILEPGTPAPVSGGTRSRLAAETADPKASPMWDAAVFMSGRFAAKEAAIKAHPHRRLTFHDIIIQSARDRAPTRGSEDGAPSDEVEGEGGGPGRRSYLGSGPPVAVIRGDGNGAADQMAQISISHDGEYAMAVCIGFEPGTSNAMG